jgi:ribosome biogenesis GTPase
MNSVWDQHLPKGTFALSKKHSSSSTNHKGKSHSRPISGSVEPDEQQTIANSSSLIEGLIVAGNRGLYRVETAGGSLLCTIRGRLRKQLVYPESTSARKSVQKVTVKDHDPVAVGDRVRVLATGGGSGVIEEVIARAGGAFVRGDLDPGQGHVTAVAGIDQMIIVFAAREPTPHRRMLDRFLVLAEAQHLSALVCINKVDLGLEPWLEARLMVYRALGYLVVLTSVASGQGLDELRSRLAGRTSALLGPSGVGKSSLLNALQPELGQRVGAVSAVTNKGRHTTSGTRLFPLDGPDGGFIADTAGIRELALGRAITEQLDWCFPEFRSYLGTCRLFDCSHLHEPDCAIRAAVQAGAVDRARYASYGRLCRGGNNAPEENFDDDD